MRRKELCDSTGNGGVFKKARKLLISKKERICALCTYHGGENSRRNRFDKRNWKRHRMTKWKQRRPVRRK